MKISEIIQIIKSNSRGELHGQKCSDERDKILYGSEDKECTGIVTTVFGSVDVLKEAARLGANLVIVNESVFWNHGDATEWLEDNQVFQEKKKILEENDITIWRYHEYNRSGIMIDGKFTDPVNYGLCWKMGWEDRIVKSPVDEDIFAEWMVLEFEGRKVSEIAKEMKEKLGLNGIQIVGDPNTLVYTLYVPPGSIMGYTPFDNAIISHTEKNGYDCILGLELVDYTVSEYVRDSAMSGRKRAIIHVGHFNAEEPGMEYVSRWLTTILSAEKLPVHYVNSKDPYEYI